MSGMKTRGFNPNTASTGINPVGSALSNLYTKLQMRPVSSQMNYISRLQAEIRVYEYEYEKSPRLPYSYTYSYTHISPKQHSSLKVCLVAALLR